MLASKPPIDGFAKALGVDGKRFMPSLIVDDGLDPAKRDENRSLLGYPKRSAFITTRVDGGTYMDPAD